MNHQQQQAKEYYFGTTKTKKEIAQSVGVCEKTIHRWIKQEAWDSLKQAAHAMPCIMVDNMCSQLIELQNNIAEREEGQRYPSLQEAEITRKLVNCIAKMKEYPSLPMHIQMMMGFSNYIDVADRDFSIKFVKYADRYFKDKNLQGQFPYQLEYGNKPLAANRQEISTIKEEIEQEERGTDQPQQSATTMQEKESPIDIVTLNKDSVMVSAVEPRHTPNENPEAHPQTTEEKQLDKPDIPTPTPTETSPQQSSQSADQPNTPCPSPDKTGHLSGTSVLIPPGNVIWLGGNQVYDPQINIKREIKSGEANWLYRNGYIKR